MSSILSGATSLSPNVRQAIGIQVLARTEPISHLAAARQAGRKFIYQQGDKARRSLDTTFAPSQGNDEVLSHLPVTQNWLYQLILGIFTARIAVSLSCFAISLIRRSVWALSTIGSKLLQQPLRSIKPKTFQALRWVCTMRLTRLINLC